MLPLAGAARPRGGCERGRSWSSGVVTCYGAVMQSLSKWVISSRWRGAIALTMFTATLACNSGSGELFGAGGGGTGGQSAGSAQGGNGTGGGGGFGLGVGGGATGGHGPDVCEAVDFLFVIDNSVSMRDQQTALIASFPQFMATIESTLETTNWHIMVVDTDAETRCTPANCMSGSFGAQKLCLDNPDTNNGYACTATFEACDNTIGAGVLNPAGDGASNQLCDVAGGNRYMVENDPDLAGTFGCIAQVGLAGHPAERPMDAIVAAMAPAINAPGGCNAGFLRQEAILVVTFISDDPNVEDAGLPQNWYDAVVSAKGGDPGAVVVLGLTPAFDGCSNPNKPDKGKHWSNFIKLFGDHGLEGSVCSSEYNSFFQSAVSIIDKACDEFEPPK